MAVDMERRGSVAVITVHRPQARNAIDSEHARALSDLFQAFEADESAAVAVLYGAGGSFCAGFDLKAVAAGTADHLVPPDGPNLGPMGPTRLVLSKPVIAAVEGHAVAGGLELALWADLRVADPGAVFGVFCRRWGVPLIDGGTVRLPRLIGQSRALDMILTGRPVEADEALAIGLANRVSEPGKALDEAVALARGIAEFPQQCLRNDRLSTYEQEHLSVAEALENEWRRGMASLEAGAVAGASRFAAGHGRHGSFG